MKKYRAGFEKYHDFCPQNNSWGWEEGGLDKLEKGGLPLSQ